MSESCCIEHEKFRCKVCKSSQMEVALNGLTKSMFGRLRNKYECVTCGSGMVKYNDFRDELSRKEFGISRMCQPCQDSVFNEG